jgi:hypothetical protein
MSRNLFAITGFFFISFLIILFLSEGSSDPGDGIRHFEIAHYSLSHPQLFLHHWGKPFFTLAAAGPSQFGLNGLIIFNIICAMLTALLTFRISEKLFPGRNSLIVIPFLLLTPVYFAVIFSGLTEPFFALVLTSGIFLFTRKKFAVSAFLISFLPFIRTEGFLLLPLFGILFLYRKNFLSALLLSAGTVIYSIAGGLIYGDFLWVIHQNPYANLNQNYGSGSLFYFLGKNEFILGIPLVICFVLGIISFFQKRNNRFSGKSANTWILAAGCFCIYFFAHSWFYWKGGYGSIGLIRVIAGVAPCMAIICLAGYHFLISFIPDKGPIQLTFNLVLAGALCFYVVRQYPLPFQKTHEQVQLDKAAALIKSSSSCTGVIWYQHPYLTYALEEDPFNTDRFRELWGYNRDQPCLELGPEDCMVWDSHYAQYEAGIDEEIIAGCGNINKVIEFVSGKKEADMKKGSEFYRVIIFNKRSLVQTFPLSYRR